MGNQAAAVVVVPVDWQRIDGNRCHHGVWLLPEKPAAIREVIISEDRVPLHVFYSISNQHFTSVDTLTMTTRKREEDGPTVFSATDASGKETKILT